MRRLMTAGALALGATFAITGAASAQDCPVKLGAILPVSGPMGQVGERISNTGAFAVKLFNEAGGVKGCPVEYVLRDTQGQSAIGVDAAKSLVDLEGVKVLLGAVSSGVSMPILTSVTVPGDVLQMSCCSSSTAFTGLAEEGKTNGLWFRTFATTGVQSAMGAKVAADKGYKSVAIMYKNDDWGQDMARLIAADFAAVGVEVTSSVAVNDGQPSYRAEVTEALSGQPEALYLALYPAEGTAAVREWISLGGTQNMIMANSLKSDEFRDNVGMQYLGSALGTDTASARSESADAFRAAYMERFDAEPNGPGLANSYDAAMIALLAMEAAGQNASGPDIAAAVAKVTDPNGTPVSADTAGFAAAKDVLSGGGTVMFQGATGNVRFDGNGDVSAPAVVWSFSDSGTEEVEYMSLDDVDAFVASLK